jgi:hypothetical protein
MDDAGNLSKTKPLRHRSKSISHLVQTNCGGPSNTHISSQSMRRTTTSAKGAYEQGTDGMLEAEMENLAMDYSPEPRYEFGMAEQADL